MTALPDRPVDPRIERSRHVILHAALAELGERGYGAFAIESVAARAGVGKSTIYRHWPDKLSLIAAAFETFHEEVGPELRGGPVREDVARILRHVAELLVDSPFSACMPALIDAADRDPGLRAFHHRFQAEARRPLVDLIARGVANGELTSDVDPELAAYSLLGAVFFQRLMTPRPFDPARVGDLVRAVLGPDPG